MSTPDPFKTILDTRGDAANGIDDEQLPIESEKPAPWVSTIHILDKSMQRRDHFEFMEKFKPHPDVAAAWLFNDIGEQP